MQIYHSLRRPENSTPTHRRKQMRAHQTNTKTQKKNDCDRFIKIKKNGGVWPPHGLHHKANTTNTNWRQLMLMVMMAEDDAMLMMVMTEEDDGRRWCNADDAMVMMTDEDDATNWRQLMLMVMTTEDDVSSSGLARAHTEVLMNVWSNSIKHLEPLDTPTKWTPRLQKFMKNSEQSICWTSFWQKCQKHLDHTWSKWGRFGANTIRTMQQTSKHPVRDRCWNEAAKIGISLNIKRELLPLVEDIDRTPARLRADL